MNYLSKIKLFLITTFIFSTLIVNGYAYIIKIDKTAVSLKEYQEYINNKKYLANVKTIDELLKIGQTDQKKMLNEYVNEKIILLAAKKKGYTLKTKTIKKDYQTSKDDFILKIYSTINIDKEKAQIDEAYIKKFYEKNIPQAKEKKFESLAIQERQQLAKYASLKKKEELDEILKQKLEKKFSVKRFKDNKKIIAEIEGAKITQKQVDKLFQERLEQIGVTIKQLQEKDPINYKKAKNKVREQLIFEKLLALDIQKTKFKAKKKTKQALKFYAKSLIIKEFIAREIALKTPVSDQEMDQAFKVMSKRNPQITQMLPSQQEKYLKQIIIQQKLPQIFREYLSEQKEAIIIKKNWAELKKVS